MNTAIILAAGKGKRMNAGMNKQHIEIMDKPVMIHTIEVFEKCSMIDNIILVVANEERELCNRMIQLYAFQKVNKVIAGGVERQDSVFCGLEELDESCDIVLIHDGARMLVTESIIIKCINNAMKYGAATAGVPVKDTIKIVENENIVKSTPKRENIWITQTPQGFKKHIIIDAYEYAVINDIKATDDATLVEKTGKKVKMFNADYENIKVTTPIDIILVRTILEERLNLA